MIFIDASVNMSVLSRLMRPTTAHPPANIVVSPAARNAISSEYATYAYRKTRDHAIVSHVMTTHTFILKSPDALFTSSVYPYLPVDGGAARPRDR